MLQIESFGRLNVHFSNVKSYVSKEDYFKHGICEFDIDGVELILNNGGRIKLNCNEIQYNIDYLDLLE